MEKRLKLTPRLRLLAEWVPQGAAFVDVGTDHAYLPVWLALHGRLKSCIASELRPAPLQRARQTVREYGVTGVRFCLCDGLTGICPQDVDTIAIAGLGGENIAGILAQSTWASDGAHTLLLQPMTRAEVLREFLADNGYAIRREALVVDRGVLYPVIEAVGGKMVLTKGQQYGGAKLTRDPLGDRYLIEIILRLQNAVAGLCRAAGKGRPDGSGTNQEKADRLREILTELYSMREEWRYANRPGN